MKTIIFKENKKKIVGKTYLVINFKKNKIKYANFKWIVTMLSKASQKYMKVNMINLIKYINKNNKK